MNDNLLLLIDGVALFVLVFALYFPRYRRRDMVLAIVSINVGVLAVALVLTRAQATAGLGFGLFAVLSIVRLRSEELDQAEVAYYFSAIAIGLLGGIRITPDWISPTMMGAIVATLFIVDHPRLFASSRSQMITLGTAFTDEATLIEHLGTMLNARILRIHVRRINLVDDTTSVDVRYRLHDSNPIAR